MTVKEASMTIMTMKMELINLCVWLHWEEYNTAGEGEEELSISVEKVNEKTNRTERKGNNSVPCGSTWITIMYKCWLFI